MPSLPANTQVTGRGGSRISRPQETSEGTKLRSVRVFVKHHRSLMNFEGELQRVLELSRLEEEQRLRERARGKAKQTEIIEILDSDEEQVTSEPPISSVVDEDDDSNFQAQLALAIQASKSSGATASPSQSDLINTKVAVLSDRAKMEQERLARLKRLRPDIIQKHEAEARSHQATTARLDTDEGWNAIPPSKRHKSTSMADGELAASSAIPSGTVFWDGEIRQTGNIHALPTKDTKPVFRLTDIVGDKSDIQLIIFSSYCTDTDWLCRILPESCPVVHIAQPDSQDGLPSVKNTLPRWVKTMPRLRGGRGCMHMKFMLIFLRSGRLRIMITTANFIAYDWKSIENTVWVQDIPRRGTSPTSVNDPELASSGKKFSEHLQSILKALNVTAALRSLLSDHSEFSSNLQFPLQSLSDLSTRWDWSRVKMKIVVSLAGRWEGWEDIDRFGGHCSLSKAVREIGAKCPDDKELALECQGSSIGTYSTSWLNEFHLAGKGASAAQWLNVKRTIARSKQLPPPENIKIIFPSLATVDASVLGRRGGGTMFCRENQWSGKSFPRHLFHDSRSKRGGILMHTKMIIATFIDKKRTMPSQQLLTLFKEVRKGSANIESEDENEDESILTTGCSLNGGDNQHRRTVGGWCYIGSHNFTPSAWGNLSGTPESPVLNVTNYELGIIFHLPSSHTNETACEIASWERPPRKYVLGKDVPWMQDSHL